MKFFPGLHQPSDAKHLPTAFVSVNRLRRRKGPFAVGDWIMDSGAFTTILTHGGYPAPPLRLRGGNQALGEQRQSAGRGRTGLYVRGAYA